jgi:hypothetical protein
MSTVRAKRRFMHSTNSPLANFSFIELIAASSSGLGDLRTASPLRNSKPSLDRAPPRP